jgi:hypothetical protein
MKTEMEGEKKKKKKKKQNNKQAKGTHKDAETFRLPHFFFATGSKMVVRMSPLHQLPFTPQEDSWYSFLLEAESPQGSSMAGRIRSIKESSNFIGNRTCNLPAYNKVPQPSTLPRVPLRLYGLIKKSISLLQPSYNDNT